MSDPFGHNKKMWQPSREWSIFQEKLIEVIKVSKQVILNDRDTRAVHRALATACLSLVCSHDKEILPILEYFSEIYPEDFYTTEDLVAVRRRRIEIDDNIADIRRLRRRLDFLLQ